MSSYFENKFSKYQFGFRKGHSTQHCLIVLLERWKGAVDKGDRFGALLTDLSNASDWISPDSLVAKLNAYGFTLPSVRLVRGYLSNRKRRTRVNSFFSFWQEIHFAVPHGSLLGALLFNIFLCDLFLWQMELILRALRVIILHMW